MFGRSVAYAERFAQHETPRPRSSSFRLVHAFTVYNGTLRERAFLCGYGKDYAAAFGGLGRRIRFAGCVPSMFLTACKNDAYFSPKQLDKKVGRRNSMENGETAPQCTQCGRFPIQDQADFSVVKVEGPFNSRFYVRHDVDVCIRKELNADVVLSSRTDTSFQSLMNCDVCTCKELYAERRAVRWHGHYFPERHEL